MDLPPDLRHALAQELASIAPPVLAEHAQALSARYRADQGTRRASLIRSAPDAAAYAVTRMPATYAAAFAALRAARAGVPALRPTSLLDVGSGPGTATWAAAQIWPDMQRATLIERDEMMIALGERLARHAAAPALRDAAWHRLDLAADAWEVEEHDLVVAAYVLGELPDATATAVLARLWMQTTGALVIVEPGTPRGFAVIRRARALLIERGARIAAPCPHEADCPMPAGDWCHFAQRIARTPLHREAKAGTLSYEDEKFAYVAATRHTVPARGPRVLRHPRTRKGCVDLELCTSTGLERRTISRRDGARYKEARDAAWGSALSANADVASD